MYLMTDGGFSYRMNAVVSELYEEQLQRFLNGNALIFLKKKIHPTRFLFDFY